MLLELTVLQDLEARVLALRAGIALVKGKISLKDVKTEPTVELEAQAQRYARLAIMDPVTLKTLMSIAVAPHVTLELTQMGLLPAVSSVREATYATMGP